MCYTDVGAVYEGGGGFEHSQDSKELHTETSFAPCWVYLDIRHDVVAPVGLDACLWMPMFKHERLVAKWMSVGLPLLAEKRQSDKRTGAQFTKILGEILSFSQVYLKFILSYKDKIFIDFYM